MPETVCWGWATALGASVGVDQGKEHTPAGPHLECHRLGGTSVTCPVSPRPWMGTWDILRHRFCKAQNLCLWRRARAGPRAMLLFLIGNSGTSLTMLVVTALGQSQSYWRAALGKAEATAHVQHRKRSGDKHAGLLTLILSWPSHSHKWGWRAAGSVSAVEFPPPERKHGKWGRNVPTYTSLQARGDSKYFMCINSFNPHNNPVREIPPVHVL